MSAHLGPAPPGSPVPFVLSRDEYASNRFPPGTVFGSARARWVKVGRSLRRVCPVCFVPVDHTRALYCEAHRPRDDRRRRRPSGEPMGEPHGERDRGTRETLEKVVAYVRENPRATTHRIRLAFPLLTVREATVAEARRLAGVPRGPKFKAPEPPPLIQAAAPGAATA